MRFLLGLIVVLALAAGGVFIAAGRMAGPAIEISKPTKFVGTTSPLQVTVTAPGANLKTLSIALEQNGKQHQLFTLADPKGATVKQDGADRLLVTGAVGKDQVSELTSGPARVLVTASRPVVYGIRTVESQAAKEVQVRLERPRISIVSTHHYINHGGSEMAVYRVTPADVTSGVVVGDIEYPGFPATGVTVEGVRSRIPICESRSLRCCTIRICKTPIRALRARRSRQRGSRRLRLSAVPQAFQAQPHRARQSIPRSCRPRHSREHYRSQAGGRQPREVPRHQRRATAQECGEDSCVRRAEHGRAAVAGNRLPSVHQLRGRIGFCGSPHLRISGQGSRPADPPRLRPRLIYRHAGRWRQTAEGSCSLMSSASMATASSSITAWACNRCTRTCRRWT